MNDELYQLVFQFHTLESDTRLLSNQIELGRKLDIPINVSERQSGVINLLIRCMDLIESFHSQETTQEKARPSWEHLVMLSICAMICGTGVTLFTSSAGLVMYSSVVGSLLGTLLVQAQPKPKTLSENCISRLILTHQELTTLYLYLSSLIKT